MEETVEGKRSYTYSGPQLAAWAVKIVSIVCCTPKNEQEKQNTDDTCQPKGRIYFASSNSLAISSMFSKFAFRILGGVALEYPCPMVAQPARLNASITSRPRRPVAPVTRTVDGILDRDVLYANGKIMTCAYHILSGSADYHS